MIDIREMSVLVADDMENMFSAIRSIMRILGFGKKFQYVGNGTDALAALKAGMFDLALLDNNMPGITGLELLNIIRSDRALRDLPVIMITGHADREFITNAAESDIDAYILKPITVNLLKEKIPPIIERANNPSPMAAHLKAAGRHAEQGNLDAAIHEAQCAVAANPDSTRPLRELGYYYLRKGDLEQAESSLLKAAAMNRLDVIACTHLGDLYLQKNDSDRALQYYVKAMKISPRNYERALNLGKLLIRKKMMTKAIPVLTKVFDLSKDPLPLREEIASYCIAEGAFDYAAKLLVSIIEQDRRRPELLCRLGRVSEQLGKPDDALRYFMDAEQLDQRDVSIKLHIARNYIARGKILFAEKPIRAVLKIDPDNQEARRLFRQCF